MNQRKIGKSQFKRKNKFFLLTLDLKMLHVKILITLNMFRQNLKRKGVIYPVQSDIFDSFKNENHTLDFVEFSIN